MKTVQINVRLLGDLKSHLNQHLPDMIVFLVTKLASGAKIQETPEEKGH